VDSLSRFFYFIFWAILLGGVVALLRQRMRSFVHRRPDAKASAPPKPVPLYRDPYCGVYVSPEVSFPAPHAGQVLHFCSAECRDRYLRLVRQTASA
jgi:hypothetical protein